MVGVAAGNTLAAFIIVPDEHNPQLFGHEYTPQAQQLDAEMDHLEYFFHRSLSHLDELLNRLTSVSRSGLRRSLFQRQVLPIQV